MSFSAHLCRKVGHRIKVKFKMMDYRMRCKTFELRNEYPKNTSVVVDNSKRIIVWIPCDSRRKSYFRLYVFCEIYQCKVRNGDANALVIMQKALNN